MLVEQITLRKKETYFIVPYKRRKSIRTLNLKALLLPPDKVMFSENVKKWIQTKSHWQRKKTWRVKERVSEVSNSGAYPQQPRFIGVYTMKKFKTKEPTIMQTERRGDGRKHSPEKNWSILPSDNTGTTRFQRVEKNMIGDVLLESEPHWVDWPIKGSTIV